MSSTYFTDDKGVIYIPKSSVMDSYVVAMTDVLKSQKYLSNDAIDKIVDAFREIVSDSSKPQSNEVSPSKTKKLSPFQYNSVNGKLWRILRVMSDGSVLLETREKPADWKIQQAIIIRSAMDDDSSKNMTYGDALELEKKTGLPRNTVRRIMYNIEFGNLTDFIDEYYKMYLQIPKRKKPIQNNPQKRKEMGYGVIL